MENSYLKMNASAISVNIFSKYTIGASFEGT
jgi:hypothetical protein